MSPLYWAPLFFFFLFPLISLIHSFSFFSTDMKKRCLRPTNPSLGNYLGAGKKNNKKRRDVYRGFYLFIFFPMRQTAARLFERIDSAPTRMKRLVRSLSDSHEINLCTSVILSENKERREREREREKKHKICSN